MFDTIATILKEAMQDNATGKYSSARIISMLVAFAATIFMWKLVLLGGMSIDYFMAYLAYGTGSAGLSKFLDNGDASRQLQVTATFPKVVDAPPEPPKK